MIIPLHDEMQEIDTLFDFSQQSDSPLFFLPIVSGVLEERLYLRYVEAFRFINKCGWDSRLSRSPGFSFLKARMSYYCFCFKYLDLISIK